MRPSSSRMLVLDDGRWPSINTLPAVAPKPRRSAPSSSVKPGSWRTMSSAVTGLNRAKNAGSNCCTPSGALAGAVGFVVSCARAMPVSANVLAASASRLVKRFTSVPPVCRRAAHVGPTAFLMCESEAVSAGHFCPNGATSVSQWGGDWGIPRRSTEIPPGRQMRAANNSGSAAASVPPWRGPSPCVSRSPRPGLSRYARLRSKRHPDVKSRVPKRSPAGSSHSSK